MLQGSFERHAEATGGSVSRRPRLSEAALKLVFRRMSKKRVFFLSASDRFRNCSEVVFGVLEIIWNDLWCVQNLSRLGFTACRLVGDGLQTDLLALARIPVLL